MKNNMPVIATKVLEITICVSRDESDPGISIPQLAEIDICSDRSILIREYIEDPRRKREDNEIGWSIFHNWSEFKAFDTPRFAPAQMIEDWIKEENIDLRWLGVGL